LLVPCRGLDCVSILPGPDIEATQASKQVTSVGHDVSMTIDAANKVGHAMRLMVEGNIR
jgi:hypothetical protein